MHITEYLTSSLRAASAGLVLAVLTILFGQGMGIVFGLNEDAIKSRLKASAAEVRDTVGLLTTNKDRPSSLAPKEAASSNQKRANALDLIS